jgi:hypothetical protein
MTDEFEISVPAHTVRFDGYLDAVGRHFTTDERLCALTVWLAGSRPVLDRFTIKRAVRVSSLVADFERSISLFLASDPRERLLFYLVEYFSWYQEFFRSCVCEKLSLEGVDIGEEHLAYRLRINDGEEVIFLACWKQKNAAIPNLPRNEP